MFDLINFIDFGTYIVTFKWIVETFSHQSGQGLQKKEMLNNS